MNNDASPFQADPVLDLIRSSIPPDKPDWTENTVVMASDPRCGVSIWSHVGRMQPDRRIWEGFSLIYLPDNGMLVNRCLGVSLDAARNPEYHFRPIIPNRVWSFRFDGVMQRVDPDALRYRPVGDEPFEAVSYDLIFDALHPVFNLHRSDPTSERMHLDHSGRIKGTVIAGGRRFDIDCTGMRDHSVTRRTFGTLDGQVWANCAFPSGRAFSFQEVKRKERHTLEAYVFIDGRLELATGEGMPSLEDTAGNPHRGTIRLASPFGDHEIRWETVGDRFIPFELLHPVGLRPGINRSNVEHVVAVQCPVRYEWDGEVGYCWIERCRPLKALRE